MNAFTLRRFILTVDAANDATWDRVLMTLLCRCWPSEHSQHN